MASGEDLTHPDEARERERAIAEREARAQDEKPADIKVRIAVAGADGDVVREFEHEPHQGINRVVWNMRRDGVRAMPGGEPPESDVLPAGAEVPPGRYTITLTLTGTKDADDIEPLVAEVDTRHDPRSPHSLADVERQYDTLLMLQALSADAVTAVERVVHARDDVATIKGKIEKIDKDARSEQQEQLLERADEVTKALTEIEKLIRVPPKTKGIVYDADKLTSHIGLAQFYVGSTRGAPSAAALTYVDIARRESARILGEVEDYLGGDLVRFRDEARAAGIGLLTGLGSRD